MSNSIGGTALLDDVLDFSNPRVLKGVLHANSDEELAVLAQYYVNDRQIAASAGHPLSPLLADLIDVALAAYLADRIVPQPYREASRFERWRGRRLRLKVAVREGEAWSRPEIGERLSKLLYFFTEDDWSFEFVEHSGPRRVSESQAFLFDALPPDKLRVALYSGGLDSFAGAAQQVLTHSDHNFILVSGATNARHRARQRAQVAAIRKATGRDPDHVTVSFGRTWLDGLTHEEESSQRTRGFLFLSLGSAAAISVGCRSLDVYENGIGAINLPYDGTQVGVSNSRAVHPASLLRMSEFVGLLSGAPFQIENRFLFHTKAEMCAHEVVTRLGPNIRQTFSCDGFPVRAHNRPQCGSCTSCLLRRLSIERAGLSRFDPGGEYLVDLLSAGGAGSAKQLGPLRAMDWQARKIRRALSEADPWRGITREFPALRLVESEMAGGTDTSTSDLREGLTRLYANYVREWEHFSARGRLRPAA